MKRLGLVLASVTIAAVSTGAALACSCVGYRTAKEQFAKVDIAFVGTVESQAAHEGPQGVGLVRTRFRVVETLKGEVRTDRTVGHATDDGGNCGIDYKQGETILVFAYETPGGPMTSSCSAPQFPLADFQRLAATEK